MAKDITILGASYSAVPAVVLPQTGGGTARFDDVTVTTATAEDVAQGKVFVASDGTITTGTSSGGGGSQGWQRPAEFPDYSKLDISNEEVLYLTYDTRIEPSFICCYFDGNTIIDIGTLSNGVYTALKSTEVARNARYFELLNDYQTDYVVVRIRPNGGHILRYTGTNIGVYEYDGVKYYAQTQTMVEAYGRLPYVTTLNLTFRNARYIKSITLFDMNAVTSFERICGEAGLLENVDISGVPAENKCSLYYAFQTCNKLKYLYLHGAGAGGFLGAFVNCHRLEHTDIESLALEYTATNGSITTAFQYCYSLPDLDLSGWTVENVTNASSAFQGMRGDVDISTWSIAGNFSNIFFDSGVKEQPVANFGTLTNIGSFFRNCIINGTLDLSVFDFGTINTMGAYTVQGVFIRSIIVPANFTTINAMAMRDCWSLQEFHFLATTPPTLGATSALVTGNSCLMHIYVPYSEDHSVLQAYQNATNWSTLTQYLVEEDPT